MKSINPATGATIKEYPEHTTQEAAAIVDAAHTAFGTWKGTASAERSALMRKAAAVLRLRADEFALLMTQEMGKTLASARSEIEKCAWVCEHYAENAETYLKEDDIATEASRSYARCEPLGVVLAVMPWNFPFWQVFRFAAPGLMAGNVGVLKHASNVPGCALAIESVFTEAGFPPDVFRTLLIPSKQVEAIIMHPHVKAITLTGSTPAGKAVASSAGRALKKTVLELGGSDPYIVLKDADLDLAVSACVTSRLINAGQSCIAAKRFIVVPEVLDAFTERFVALMRAKKMGDPMLPATDLGPQAREDLRDELHTQVRGSIENGAVLLLGGEIPPGTGAFYPPTVLTNVRKGMPAYDEELFGPVAAIIPAKDEEDAIRIANDTIFGLGAAVFTKDTARGERIAQRIDAGCVFVNSFVKSDPRLPFGGIKESGYGRELSSYGIKEFVNIKTIYLA